VSTIVISPRSSTRYELTTPPADAMDALGDLHRRPAVVFRGKSSTGTRWPAANRAINQPDLSMP